MDHQTFKSAIMTAKTELRDAVAHKVVLTSERVEYKLRTRGNVPESTRRGWFERMDSERSSAKYSIRHLHLAYGYLRGQDYRRMEPKVRYNPCSHVIAGDLMRWLGRNAEHCDATTIEGWLQGTKSPFIRPPMSDAMKHYRSLERRLCDIRAGHSKDTKHEESILDEMDKVWYSLKDAEHVAPDGEVAA